MSLDTNDLLALGLSPKVLGQVQALSEQHTGPALWQALCAQVLTPALPDSVHQALYRWCYRDRDIYQDPGPMWLPDHRALQHSHLAKAICAHAFEDYAAFYQWSIDQQSDFLAWTFAQQSIQFKQPYQTIRDLDTPLEAPRWLPGAKMNIVDSCLPSHEGTLCAAALETASDEPKLPAWQTLAAISFWDAATQSVQQWSYQQLAAEAQCIAEALLLLGVQPQQAIGLAWVMAPKSVALYLAIIKIGAVVVPVAESFSASEMAVRFDIADVTHVFTQHTLQWQGKDKALYEKVCAATEKPVIVSMPAELYSGSGSEQVRSQDKTWAEFIKAAPVSPVHSNSVACDPHDSIAVLFSSGTTGAPKAIPWDHTTALKCALDGYYHQDVQAGDVFCWPTSLGWMMGPWLIFATLINRGCLALYQDAPTSQGFIEFVAKAKVNQLGLVPSIVKYWRTHDLLPSGEHALNWQSIKLFSSSGECSNVDDMLYLSSRAGYKPVIEYCGGTEIGGGYITNTVLQACCPTVLTTPTVGTAFCLIHTEPQGSGEVAIIPPALGLSRRLLNRDHQQTYFADMPAYQPGIPLRRHGDQIEQRGQSWFRLLGRTDDTMNLGGIKVSSADIERVLLEVASVAGCAAIAISPQGGGPSQLVVFVELNEAAMNAELSQSTVQQQLQRQVNEHLNPLFKIHEVRFITQIPRTASNKILRRTLRKLATQPLDGAAN